MSLYQFPPLGKTSGSHFEVERHTMNSGLLDRLSWNLYQCLFMTGLLTFSSDDIYKRIQWQKDFLEKSIHGLFSF